MTYETHSFYCVNCGNRGIPIARATGYKRERMHRKKIYCMHCKTEVNHIECKDMADVEEFMTNFKNGVYKNEAEESISHVRSARIG